jgi:hypothetical protein
MKKILLGAASLGLAVAALAVWVLDDLVIAALDPGVPFDASEAPPARRPIFPWWSIAAGSSRSSLTRFTT